MDTQNPYSLYNLIDSDVLKAVLERLKAECPKMLLEEELVIERKAKPTDLVCRLRLAFWDEYERAVQRKDTIKLSKVIGTHCQKDYFYEVIAKNNMWMIYILTPPRKYELTMRHILDKSTKELLEILALPLTDSRGKVDKAVMQAKIRIFDLADQRVRGAVTQRLQIQQHILQQQVSSDELVYDNFSLKELDELRDKIQIHKKEQKLIELTEEEPQ